MRTPAEDHVGTHLGRTQFYRDGYRLLLRIVLGEVVLVGILILSMIGLIFFYQPRERFFATAFSGQVDAIATLDQPGLSDAEILAWAAISARTLLSHDPAREGGMPEKLARVRPLFLEEAGWRAYGAFLNQIQFVAAIEGGWQARAAVAGPPSLGASGVAEGGSIYGWTVELPVQVTYTRGGQTQQGGYPLRLVISRALTLENVEGIGILSIGLATAEGG